MTLFEFVAIASGILLVINLMVLDHHERMAKIKYTQGHNE